MSCPFDLRCPLLEHTVVLNDSQHAQKDRARPRPIPPTKLGHCYFKVFSKTTEQPANNHQVIQKNNRQDFDEVKEELAPAEKYRKS